ncbi:MAG: SDR family oxidoreductase [Gammaproteobacteria bacterium]|nr:SDR family oxidoreductase [Gammaproteobacteria bacterium]MCY4218649.1 SDR family oxidoreductase [Gammaproteobacteria bacterium]MCY4274803.1 SDR family oxidoreductase [Gammaproteobacteria bacterium]
MKPAINKKAIVLGGSSGIGLETSRLLANQGVEVIVGSRRGVLDEPLSGVHVESVDVLDRQSLQSFLERHRQFDYLVNSATGGQRAVGPFLDMDIEGFRGSFAKLWGYTNSVHLGARHVKSNGAIVLVSGYPARRFKPGYIAISTVGNAVEGFVRGMAHELKPIRINAVAPGLIDTPMFSQQGHDREIFLSESTKDHLIPRAGKPEEVAKAIQFALENEFVTGTTIDVDGGALIH